MRNARAILSASSLTGARISRGIRPPQNYGPDVSDYRCVRVAVSGLSTRFRVFASAVAVAALCCFTGDRDFWRYRMGGTDDPVINSLEIVG